MGQLTIEAEAPPGVVEDDAREIADRMELIAVSVEPGPNSAWSVTCEGDNEEQSLREFKDSAETILRLVEGEYSDVQRGYRRKGIHGKYVIRLVY